MDGVKISDDTKDLLNSILSYDPSKRPSAEDILKHPFFKNKLTEDHQLPPDKLNYEIISEAVSFAERDEYAEGTFY